MTASGRLSLLDRSPEGIFARRNGVEIDAQTFLRHVHALAGCLPGADHVFNLVEDRYLFTVAFVAIVAVGKVNLLPPNPKPAVQARIADRFDTVAVVHDGQAVAPGLPEYRIERLDEEPGGIPGRDAGDIVAISFTSGSTGEHQAIAKTLGMFRGAVELYRETFIPADSHMVATVPAQHMYGLELASLLPLWSPVCITAGKPLFPADVLGALLDVPPPRVLITTPFHLLALLDSGLQLPELERVICATAPLDPDLASHGEAALGAPVVDIYGCSEAGCMALRRPALGEEFALFPGLSFRHDGEQTILHGPHLDAPVSLADRIERVGAETFRIVGRLSDQIKVAGKRGSLGEITRCLLAVPGVEDGIVFAPSDEAINQRPAALYQGVATKTQIRRHMSQFLDDACIPRPLIRVDRLPRTDTSKLPREVLLDLYRQHRQKR